MWNKFDKTCNFVSTALALILLLFGWYFIEMTDKCKKKNNSINLTQFCIAASSSDIFVSFEAGKGEIHQGSYKYMQRVERSKLNS